MQQSTPSTLAGERQVVWERYVASWKAESVAKKRDLYAESLAKSCVYTDPLIQARGWDALLEYMAEFHRQIPGGHFVTQEYRYHHGCSVARWLMKDGTGATRGEGISYAEYGDDGKLTAMTGFFEVPAGSA